MELDGVPLFCTSRYNTTLARNGCKFCFVGTLYCVWRRRFGFYFLSENDFSNFIFFLFLAFSLKWNFMGAKISKHHSSYQSQTKVFKVFLMFVLNGPLKGMLMFFFEIFVNFNFYDFFLVNMGPYGSQNFKVLLLLQILGETFQNFFWLFSNGPHKIALSFLKFWNWNFINL